MSVIALLNYEESALRIYKKTSNVSIISEQPSYMYMIHGYIECNLISRQSCYV